MNFKKTTLFIILLLSACLLALSSCSENAENAPEGEPPLGEIVLSDGRSEPIYRDVEVYAFGVPDGHPLIPTVSFAGEDGYTAEIGQAMMAEGADVAYASIKLTDGTEELSFRAVFRKDPGLGFSLQYDDRYTFVPDYTLSEGEEFYFAFDSYPEHLYVDPSTGKISVTGVSDEPVVVRAFVEGQDVDSLTVDMTTPAVVDVFLITGQGNAAGIGGSAEGSPHPEKGRVYYSEAGSDGMIDMYEGREGLMPAFASDWYERTGRKSFVIQAGFARTSVTEWREGGEIYESICSTLDKFTGFFSDGSSPYLLGRGTVLWLHGEWDIASGMDETEYIRSFDSMFEGLKKEYAFSLCGIIPVRSGSGEDGEGEISKIEAAQYYLHSTREDVYVLTRLPSKASTANGFVNEDGLYYTQYGYNEIGYAASETLFCIMSPEVEKRALELNMYTSEYGEGVDGRLLLNVGTSTRTIVIAEPLYAEDKIVTSESEGNGASMSEYFALSVPQDARDGDFATFTFRCGELSLNVTVLSVNETHNEALSADYLWNFGGTLEDASEDAPLALSQSSGEYVSDGEGAILNGNTDFSASHAVILGSERGWYVEWKGSMTDNGIVIGGDMKNAGYILLAPFSERFGNSVRVVFDSGKAEYLPYGEYKSSARENATWRVSYEPETAVLSLSCEGETVCETQVEPFRLTFTNLFGRYASETSPYCYSGKVEYVALHVD